MDYVIRLENFNTDFQYVLDTLKLPINLEDVHIYNEHTSRDKSISYRNFYQNNQTLIDIVYHEFYDDIKRFNYTF